MELTQHTVLAYLRDTGQLDRSLPADAELLAWGVSNMVFRIHPETGDDFVVKQSRKPLRTKAEWFSQLERIHTEMDLMRHLSSRVPTGSIPQVLFEDRANYLFGMEAVAADHRVWKAELLDGVADQTIAQQAGELLATIHHETALQPELQRRFGDRTVFDELRVDPFYRYLLPQHPPIAPALERVIQEVLSREVCVVHADFSPKNLLLSNQRLTLVDFETGHFGDPAFDLGFFLSHLLLKTIKHIQRRSEFLSLAESFWESYRLQLPRRKLDSNNPFEQKELERRTLGNLGGCLLARIDGKSPIDYFDQPWQSEVARSLAFAYLMRPITEVRTLLPKLTKCWPIPHGIITKKPTASVGRKPHDFYGLA